MSEDQSELELCCQVFAQVLGVETDEIHFSELLERAKQLLFDLPEGWEVVTGQSDLEGIPMFFNSSKQFSQWNHPSEEQHTNTIHKLRDDLNKHDSELVHIDTNISDPPVGELDNSTLMVSESPVVQNLNFVSEIEIIFAQLLGVDTSEPNSFQLIFLAKELLYSLPPGWEVVSGQSDLGIIPYFFDTTTGQSFWSHPFEDECIQILENKRIELNGGRSTVNTIEEGEEDDTSQMSPQKGEAQIQSGDGLDIHITHNTGSEKSIREEDTDLLELTELDILFAHVLGVEVDTEPHAMELCYLAKALLYELPDTWEISVSVSEEMGGAAVPIFYDNESQTSYWTHPFEASHRRRIEEARELLREQQRADADAVDSAAVMELPSVVEMIEPSAETVADDPVVVKTVVVPNVIESTELIDSVVVETDVTVSEAEMEPESKKINYIVAEDGSVDVAPSEVLASEPDVVSMSVILETAVIPPEVTADIEPVVVLHDTLVPDKINILDETPLTMELEAEGSVVLSDVSSDPLLEVEVVQSVIAVDQPPTITQEEEKDDIDLDIMLLQQLDISSTVPSVEVDISAEALRCVSPKQIVDYLQSEDFSGVNIMSEEAENETKQTEDVVASQDTVDDDNKRDQLLAEEAQQKLIEEAAESERLAAEAVAAQLLVDAEGERVRQEKETAALEAVKATLCEEAVESVTSAEVDSLFAEGADAAVAEAIQQAETIRAEEEECVTTVTDQVLSEVADETVTNCVEIVILSATEAAEDLARRERETFVPPPLILNSVSFSPDKYSEWVDEEEGEVRDLNHFTLPLSARDVAVGASKPVTPFTAQIEQPVAKRVATKQGESPAAIEEFPLEIISTPVKSALVVITDDAQTPPPEKSLIVQAPQTGGDSVHSGGAHSSAHTSLKNKQSLPGPVDALLHQRIIKVKTDYLKMLRSNKVTDSKLSVVSTSPNKQEHSASESENSPYKANAKKQQQLKGTLFTDIVPDFTSSPARTGQFKRLAPMDSICSAVPLTILPGLSATQLVSKGPKWHLLGSYDIHKEAVKARQVIVHLVNTDSFGTILIDPRDNFLDSHLEAEIAAEKQEKERLKTAALQNSLSTHSLMSSANGAFDRHSPTHVHSLSMKPELIIGRMKSNSEKTVKIRIRRDTGRMQWVVETDDNPVRKIVKRHRKKGKVENNMLENSTGNTVKRITKRVTPAPTAETLTEVKSFGLISKIPTVDLSQSLPFRKDRESRGNQQRGGNGDSGGESPPRMQKPRSRALQRGSSNNNHEEHEERSSELRHSRSEASGMLRHVQSSEGPLRLPNIGRNIAST